MKQLVRDVYRLDGLRGGNAYMLVTASGLCMIDTGMAGDGTRIGTQIEQRGYSLQNIRHIIVTHAHSDHTGGMGEIVRQSGAQIMAHREEAPYIEGMANLPSGSTFQTVFIWLEDRFSRREKCITVSRELKDGDILWDIHGLHVFHVPGHTPGSICLYQKETAILFTGDLLFNGNPFTGRGGLRYAPRMFSVDPEGLVDSAEKISHLPVSILCVGHGTPVQNTPAVRLKNLLNRIS